MARGLRAMGAGHATGGARPELPYTKLGGRLLFRREKIEEFIEMHSKGSAA